MLGLFSKRRRSKAVRAGLILIPGSALRHIPGTCATTIASDSRGRPVTSSMRSPRAIRLRGFQNSLASHVVRAARIILTMYFRTYWPFVHSSCARYSAVDDWSEQGTPYVQSRVALSSH